MRGRRARGVVLCGLLAVLGACGPDGRAMKQEGDRLRAKDDLVVAAEAYRRACDADYAEGCSEAGVYISWKAIEGKGPVEEVLRVWEKACRLGAGSGCSRLGLLYDSGWHARLVPEDLERARRLYERACDALGDGSGCYNLSELHGAGGRTDLAGRYMELSCQRKYASACIKLGRL